MGIPGAPSQDGLYSWPSVPTTQNTAGLLHAFTFCLCVFCDKMPDEDSLGRKGFDLAHGLEGRKHMAAGPRWLGILHGVHPHFSFH